MPGFIFKESGGGIDEVGLSKEYPYPYLWMAKSMAKSIAVHIMYIHTVSTRKKCSPKNRQYHCFFDCERTRMASYEFLCTNQKASLRAIDWYGTSHSSDQLFSHNFLSGFPQKLLDSNIYSG